MKKSDSPVSKPSPTYVTREELDALTKVVGIALARVELAHQRAGYADGTISHQLARAERAADPSAAEHAALKAIIKAFDRTIDQHRAVEQRRERDRGSAYQHM